jgi:glycosyltransferase involved in cell wall biosynthesis
MADGRNRIFFLRKITRFLYRYRGLSRVAELVRKAYIHDPRRFRIDDLDGDLSFDCALNEHISSQVFWRGDYSTGQLAILRRVLRPGMVFLDAGANKGEFTVVAAKYVEGRSTRDLSGWKTPDSSGGKPTNDPVGKVLAFEPMEATAKELRANLAANGFSQAEVIEKALGAAKGERVIYHAGNDDKKELNLGTFTLYPRTGLERPCGKIGVVSLDEWIGSADRSGGEGSEAGRWGDADAGRIDVMKIDIEGGELEMLQGAVETIRRWRPVIFIEVNAITSRAAGYDHREILRWLEGMGYRCERIGRRGKAKPVTVGGLKGFQNLVCWPKTGAQKIAFFIPDLRGGGAEKTVVNLLKEMVRRQPSPTLQLVLADLAGSYWHEIPEGVQVFGWQKKRTLSALPDLVRYLWKNRPSVLITHLSHANVIALLAKKISGVHTRVIVVEHIVMGTQPSFFSKQGLLEWGMKKMYPGAAAIVAVSEASAAGLASRLGLPDSSVRTVYNPVVDHALPEKAKLPTGHPWLEKKDRPVFLAVGRMETEKDHSTLLEAFARVRSARLAAGKGGLRLILLGEGSLRPALEAQAKRLSIQEDVSMPGFAENPFAYMARCDAFVLTSLSEGLSNVLIEALACGCPVVATDCPGGPREILEDCRFGLLTPVGDAVAMAVAMERTLEISLAEQQGQATADAETPGSEWMRARRWERMQRGAFFSSERAADGYLALLNDIGSGKWPRGIKRRVVLHVITGLHTGGAERMLCQLLSAMDRKDWEPVVISLTDGGRPEAWLREQGIAVYCLGMRAGSLPGPGLLRKLIRLAKTIRPDLIQGWMYHGNLAAQFVARFVPVGAPSRQKGMRRVPVIWSIHHSIGSPGVKSGSPGADNASLGVEKKMTARIIRLGARLSGLPARIVYASYVSAGQHRALGYRAEKEIVIPYGVDTEFYIPSTEARAAMREELGISLGDIVIGSLARYHPMKDHGNFLRAAAQRDGLRFVLAGRGVDEKNTVLVSLIAELGIGERVILLGERGDPERVLAACDIFTVASSHGEALPMVLLEAMSCGLPCVTTDVGDAGRLVGDTGRVVAPRDAGALAGAWAELAEMGERKRNSLGEAARARVVAHYTLSASASAYAALYRELVG